jgi:DNA repair protein RadC
MKPIEENYGHRQRLREKFQKAGLDGFQDYEIVEMLLGLGRPRVDTKHMAKEAIDRFKTLRGVLEASEEELDGIPGIGEASIFGLKFTQAVAQRFLKDKSLEKPFTASSEEVYQYFYHAMRGLRKEMIKAVYLNSQNQILEIRDFQEGTVDSSYVYPREILQYLLKSEAVSLVLVHNHPSGNPNPSEADRELTRNMVFAAIVMQVKLLDHIIIGDNRYFSFGAEGLVAKYESEFARLKMKAAEG